MGITKKKSKISKLEKNKSQLKKRHTRKSRDQTGGGFFTKSSGSSQPKVFAALTKNKLYNQMDSTPRQWKKINVQKYENAYGVLIARAEFGKKPYNLYYMQCGLMKDETCKGGNILGNLKELLIISNENPINTAGGKSKTLQNESSAGIYILADISNKKRLFYIIRGMGIDAINEKILLNVQDLQTSELNNMPLKGDINVINSWNNIWTDWIPDTNKTPQNTANINNLTDVGGMIIGSDYLIKNKNKDKTKNKLTLNIRVENENKDIPVDIRNLEFKEIEELTQLAAKTKAEEATTTTNKEKGKFGPRATPFHNTREARKARKANTAASSPEIEMTTSPNVSSVTDGTDEAAPAAEAEEATTTTTPTPPNKVNNEDTTSGIELTELTEEAAAKKAAAKKAAAKKAAAEKAAAAAKRVIPKNSFEIDTTQPKRNTIKKSLKNFANRFLTRKHRKQNNPIITSNQSATETDVHPHSMTGGI
jgi:hypothetical protein